MNNDWYLLRAGQTFGPYPSLYVQQMAAAGEFAAGDLLSQGSSGNWAPPHHVLAFLAANSVSPLVAMSPVADDFGSPPDEVRASAARTQAQAAQQMVWSRYKIPILIAGATAAVVVAGVAIFMATLPTRRPAIAQHPEKPAAAKSKMPKGWPSHEASKSHANARKAREYWLAAKGEPLETHSSLKTPKVEILVWRTGNDQHDLAILNYTTGATSLKINIPRLTVEATIDSLHRK